MTTLLSTLAIAFAAFCVWLTVRIVNRRERWAKLTLVAAVGVPVLYLASFGPACWIVGRTGGGDYTVATTYAPLMKAARCLGNGAANLLWEYSALAGDEACRIGLGVAFESTRYDH